MKISKISLSAACIAGAAAFAPRAPTATQPLVAMRAATLDRVDALAPLDYVNEHYADLIFGIEADEVQEPLDVVRDHHLRLAEDIRESAAAPLDRVALFQGGLAREFLALENDWSLSSQLQTAWSVHDEELRA
mmetsp:Transcript_28639/g.88568  ORF Transcript_28639/g.88568 Transcript_28639/m.88568 type:complete len:133 (+) Transcript_28639:154-552(+)